MNLNKELNRKIRCFLVTNNENNICQDITYKRVQNVIAGYLKNNGDKVEGLKSNSLRYYRTAFVDREPTQTNRRKLMELSTDMLCIKENLYDEQPKFGRIKLNPKGARYFEHGDNRMLIIYRPEFISFFVDEIGKMELNEPIKVYVYSPGRYAYDDEFSIVAEKVLLCALPEAILEAMVRILPKRVSKKTVEEAAPALVESESNNNDLFSNL
jgi:adenine-specific DNA-methyltransferase